MVLDLFSKSELIKKEGDFEDYIVSIKDNYFSVLTLSYENVEPEVSYQTDWFDTKEQAMQAYENDLQ